VEDEKIRMFMKLAGQSQKTVLDTGSADQRKLGAQLLLSEVLEYVIKGLGVVPVYEGTEIKDPNALNYKSSVADPDKIEMIDGLADVAYTMFWNSNAFGIPLEEAFDMVCDNNLEKFVKLSGDFNEGVLEKEKWHCDKAIQWPSEVVQVEVLRVNEKLFAVGKDHTGKVRKPSSFPQLDLAELL